jgi:hypothetical protein
MSPHNGRSLLTFSKKGPQPAPVPPPIQFARPRGGAGPQLHMKTPANPVLPFVEPNDAPPKVG